MNIKKPSIVSKSQTIEDWKVKGKIIQEMRDYVEVKIINSQDITYYKIIQSRV